MKMKAVVCGTTFGQSYMRAIEMMDEVQLAGIVAYGSERSKECAKQYKVSLYTDIENIPGDIEIAFVIVKSSVLGGEGTDLSKRLLERGIHVMQEHPVNHKEMEECFKIARKNKVQYEVGNLYPSLENVDRFIQAADCLNTHDELKYADVFTSSQGLYTLVDILSRALPNFRNLKTACPSQEQMGPFSKLTMTDGKIHIHIQVHNEVSDQDGNNHMHLLHKLIFFYESGRLELEDTFGSVTWRARMNISDSSVLKKDERKKELDRLMSLNLFQEQDVCFSQLLLTIFPEAIKKEIEQLTDGIKSSKADIPKIQREILTAQKWKLITEEIGFPTYAGCKEQYPDCTDFLRKIR